MAHVAALRAHAGNLPVGVTVFVEGEEESGSPSLGDHPREARRPAAPPTPSSSPTPATGTSATPALTTTLRGGIRVVVEVQTLDHSVHSGMFGGAAPDAVTALVRLLASLHDADGNVAVAGLDAGEAADIDYDENRFRAESGLLDGVSLDRVRARSSADCGTSPRSRPSASTRRRSTRRRTPCPPRPPPRSRSASHRRRTRWWPTTGSASTSRPTPRGARAHRRARGARLRLRGRRRRPGLRPGACVVRRRVGRRAGRHGRRWLDPVHLRLLGALPERVDHRHGRRGPRHARARRQRVPAPRASSRRSVWPRRSSSPAWERCPEADARRHRPGPPRQEAGLPAPR